LVFPHVVPDPTVEDVYDYGLFLIREALLRMDSDLYPPMPSPQRNWAEFDTGNRFIQEQQSYDQDIEGQKAEQNIGGFAFLRTNSLVY
jgi:hypothetical protein